MTITTRGEYSGTVTYHEGKFALANNILVMHLPKEWSKKAKIYFATLISKLGYSGFNGYPRKETLKNDVISLPVLPSLRGASEESNETNHSLELESGLPRVSSETLAMTTKVPYNEKSSNDKKPTLCIDFNFIESFISAAQKECIKSVVLWREKEKAAYERVVASGIKNS